MKFNELSPKFQRQALKWACSMFQELYDEQGINEQCNIDSPEVLEAVNESEYEIEYVEYEKGKGEYILRHK